VVWRGAERDFYGKLDNYGKNISKFVSKFEQIAPFISCEVTTYPVFWNAASVCIRSMSVLQ